MTDTPVNLNPTYDDQLRILAVAEGFMANDSEQVAHYLREMSIEDIFRTPAAAGWLVAHIFRKLSTDPFATLADFVQLVEIESAFAPVADEITQAQRAEREAARNDAETTNDNDK